MGDELDATTVPADFVKEGGDWLAIFNPRVPRQMDVQLAARHVHDGCVCFEDL
jgi:glucose repression regulatory protein TUP1